MPRILVVAGPTASGKSDLAIRIALKFNGEIISADSRQVYRGMDLGTGKVKRDKRVVGGRKWVVGSEKWRKADYYSEGIRHHLIDVASPKRQYSVARFKREAQRAIRDITERGKLPVVCGGTGFWIDALVYDLSLPAVKPDTKLRARLAKMTAAQLFARLKRLDPTRAATIDRHNPVRLIRALEIVLKTGAPVPSITTHYPLSTSPYHLLYLGVSRPMPEIKRRIARRLDARLNPPTGGGMLAEVRRLHHEGVSWKRLESFGLEYRWLARFVRGSTSDGARLNLKSMRDGLLRDIIAYFKRQLTWWRRNPDIMWVTSAIRAEQLIRRFLKTKSATVRRTR